MWADAHGAVAEEERRGQQRRSPWPRASSVAFSCEEATHRGQSLHVGAGQAEVADHVENPVVGCKVQRCSSVLEKTKKDPRILLTIVPEDNSYGVYPTGQRWVGDWERKRRRGPPSLEPHCLLREASQAERFQIFFSEKSNFKIKLKKMQE